MPEPRRPVAAAPEAAAPSETSTRVLRQFRLVFNSVKTHFQQVEKKVGIGGAQLWALSVIEANPGIGVTGLARRLDIHQTTASNLVRLLVDAGFASTERNGPDRRAVQLKVLPAGARLLRRAPGPFSGVLPEALAQLDEDVLLRLEADLSTLLSVLGADERAAGIPLASM